MHLNATNIHNPITIPGIKSIALHQVIFLMYLTIYFILLHSLYIIRKLL